MSKLATVLLALMTVLIAGSSASADGGMFMDEAAWRARRERTMINEPEQKAVVFFSKGKEQLIISPSFEGPSDRFAWVIPVPVRPKVEIVKGALFHELAELATPKPRLAGKAVPAGAPRAKKVEVLERKTVGAYDVSVLSATDGKALVKWLSANKYHLPAQALKPINAYVSDKWTFVACRVNAPKSTKGLRMGTLAPLKLSFPAKRPVYPMRLSSANPKPFDILVYLVVPQDESGGDSTSITTLDVPGTNSNITTFRAATLAGSQKRYPTLARLSREPLHIYKLGRRAEPKHCVKDITWQIPASVARR